MINNLHLTALTRSGESVRLYSIPLHRSLQDLLVEIWGDQYIAFVDGVDEIEFNSGYSPEEHEKFKIVGYELPEGLNGMTSLNTQGLDPIGNNVENVDEVRAILGFARDEHGHEIVLFQNFSRSHVIRPGRFLFLENGTYEHDGRPIITLDNKLSAIYFVRERKLLFHNFRVTNTFLPLADYYQEATACEIREVLSHRILAPIDIDVHAGTSNQWFRKRFAMLRNSHILDRYTPLQIEQHSRDYSVDIRIENNKIVFPSEKIAAKKLLQYLNEELFRGPITETLYETNSKREAD